MRVCVCVCVCFVCAAPVAKKQHAYAVNTPVNQKQHTGVENARYSDNSKHCAFPPFFARAGIMLRCHGAMVQWCNGMAAARLFHDCSRLWQAKSHLDASGDVEVNVFDFV